MIREKLQEIEITSESRAKQIKLLEQHQNSEIESRKVNELK